jgi:hypothetical protein
MLDNRNRVYALASWTVKSNGKGWYVRKTDTSDEWRGPYRTETSACLTIARQLKKELIKRDGLFLPL